LLPRVLAADAGLTRAAASALRAPGVTPDLLLRDQSQAQQPVLRKQLAKVEKLPPSPAQVRCNGLVALGWASSHAHRAPRPAQKAAVTEIKGDIAAGECTVTNAVKQFNLIRNGTLAVGDDGVVCPMGTYWKGGFNIPSGVYCPGSCGNHVCLLNVTTPECMGTLVGVLRCLAEALAHASVLGWMCPVS